MSKQELAEDETLIRYSYDGELYYVTGYDYLTPKTWICVDESEQSYPFQFFEIKADRDRDTVVALDHPLVQRYATVSGWPPRGSHAWRTRLEAQQRSAADRLTRARQEMDHWEATIASIATLLERFA